MYSSGTTGKPKSIVHSAGGTLIQHLKELMLHVDLVIATGSESNVRAAYRSGTPAIGVGKGNVPVIVDTSADLSDVASKIALSKTFDHATSCSAENSIVLIGETYGTLISKLEEEGGVLLTSKEKDQLQNCLWNDGQLNRQIVAKPVKKNLRGSSVGT